MKTRNKILYIITILVIIVGVVMWKMQGFKLELQYSTRDQINLSNNVGINKDEINQIVSEILGNTRYFVQEVENFGNSVSITADEISDEQKSQIVEKFNEKYGTELKADEIETISIPFTRIKDIIRPFIIPGIVITIILLVYFFIRFSDLNKGKILLKTVIFPVAAELLLYSIIAITRIPMGRIAIASGVLVYVITVILITNKLENEREEKISEEKDNK